MNLYKVERLDKYSWDEYSDFIVAAIDENTAKYTHPSEGHTTWYNNQWCYSYGEQGRPATYHGWVDDPSIKVKVTEVIPENLNNKEVICASFHAG